MRTEAEKWRDVGYELVQRLAPLADKFEARARRAELNSWPRSRPNLVRAKQGRAS